MRKTQIVLALVVALLLGMQIAHYTEPRSVQAQGSGHKNKYVSTATTTPVTDGLSFLNSITINGGTAGVVTLFDVAASACTGTPGSGKFATIETIGTTNPVTLFYEQLHDFAATKRTGLPARKKKTPDVQAHAYDFRKHLPKRKRNA